MYVCKDSIAIHLTGSLPWKINNKMLVLSLPTVRESSQSFPTERESATRRRLKLSNFPGETTTLNFGRVQVLNLKTAAN